MDKIQKIIKHFNMEPLSGEGGYYTETYRSKEEINIKALPQRYEGNRNYYTSIIYLITSKNLSHLHRIKSDEIFHFYMGSPVEIINFLDDGNYRKVILGNDIFKGQSLQYKVPRNTWQAAYLKEGDFAVMGTTVSPGFDFKDYHSGKDYKSELLKQYPKHEKIIKKLL